VNSTLAAIILGTGLLLLSHFLFGGGLLTKFFEISEYATNPQHIIEVSGDESRANADVKKIISFIVEVGLYYIAAAVLVFVVGIFTSKKKPR
jgi:hypothetical protein